MAIVVGHIVDARVAEVAQDIAMVESSHRHLTDDHFLEGSESTEHCLAIVVKRKTCAGRIVAPFHDTTRNVHLRMRQADFLETARALEIAVDDLHSPNSFFCRADLVKD